MKKVVVLSGKGGTGKTTVAASFIALGKKLAAADCDVDAPNLHMVLQEEVEQEEDFYGSYLPHINEDTCIECRLCETSCPYGAIADLQINGAKCEGCGVCEYLCPVEAITMEEEITGKTYLSRIHSGIFSHARLKIGGEHSGKLVTAVRKNAEAKAEDEEIMIIDGSPGIGCMVISSMAGCDLALIVTEPTESGLHDLQRIAEVAAHFRVPTLVCINKYDLNIEKSQKIHNWCKDRGILVAGEIPFDETVYTALREAKPVVEYPDSAAGKGIAQLWERLLEFC